MKTFLKLLLLAPIAALLGLTLIKDPQGRPLLSWSQLLQPHTTEWSQQWQQLEHTVMSWFAQGAALTGHETTPVYRWQDAQGRWHYADAPPQDVDAEQVSRSLMRTPDAVEPAQLAAQTTSRQSDESRGQGGAVALEQLSAEEFSRLKAQAEQAKAQMQHRPAPAADD